MINIADIVASIKVTANLYGITGSDSFWENCLVAFIFLIIPLAVSLILQLFTSIKIWTFLFKLILGILPFSIKDSQPDWHKYKTDMFFGVKWIWDWNERTNQIVHLMPLCPDCNYELDPCDRFPADNLPGKEVVSQFPTGYQCKKCGFKKRIYEYGDLDTLIPKEIAYKIRQGIYNK